MSALSRLFGTLVPGAALVAGTAIVKQEWLPFAVAAAAAWGALRIFMGDSGLTAPEAKHAAQEVQKKAVQVKQKVVPGGVLDPDNFQEFPLKEKNVTSHNTAIYRFALPKYTDVLGLPIGQHISLAANVEGEDQQVVRSYTPISSDDKDKGYFDLMIKAYPTGRISKHMDKLKIGDTMKVRGPKGAMIYTPNMCRHIGMVAGGTGITPMLQIIRAILRGRSQGDVTEVDLIFANVTEDDILLREDLDALTRQDPGFRVHYILDKPPQTWLGGVGFVTADMIKANLPAPADDIKILACGPPPMVKSVKSITESMGYKKARPVSKLEDQVFAF